MGIVQVKIKTEDSTGSSTSLTEEKKDKSTQTRMSNTKYRNTWFYYQENKTDTPGPTKKKSFAKNNI